MGSSEARIDTEHRFYWHSPERRKTLTYIYIELYAVLQSRHMSVGPGTCQLKGVGQETVEKLSGFVNNDNSLKLRLRFFKRLKFFGIAALCAETLKKWSEKTLTNMFVHSWGLPR